MEVKRLVWSEPQISEMEVQMTMTTTDCGGKTHLGHDGQGWDILS